MSQQASLSIVIPTCNSSDYILNVVEQVYSACIEKNISFELVIVNDGSTDQTMFILKGFIDNNNPKNIKIVNLQKNYGQQMATQAGINNSKGKYIITFDDDLQYVLQDIFLLFENIKSKTNAMVVSGFYEEKLQLTTVGIVKKFVKFCFNNVFFPGYRKTGYYTSFKIFNRDLLLYNNIINIFHFWEIAPESMLAVKVKKQKRITGKSGYSSGKLIRFIYPLFLKCLSRIIAFFLFIEITIRILFLQYAAFYIIFTGMFYLFLRILVYQNKISINQVHFTLSE